MVKITSITRVVGVVEGGLNGVSQPVVINFLLIDTTSFLLLDDVGSKLIL